MKPCNKCKTEMKLIYKCIVNPINDIYYCYVCKTREFRYEHTKYERDGDPKTKE